MGVFPLSSALWRNTDGTLPRSVRLSVTSASAPSPELPGHEGEQSLEVGYGARQRLGARSAPQLGVSRVPHVIVRPFAADVHGSAHRPTHDSRRRLAPKNSLVTRSTTSRLRKALPLLVLRAGYCEIVDGQSRGCKHSDPQATCGLSVVPAGGGRRFAY